MQVGRRGFLGMLAGLLAGPKILGPMEIAAPSPAATFQRARPFGGLHCTDDMNLDLQAYSAEVLRIVEEETAWLHLNAVNCCTWSHTPRRIGDHVAVRKPERFTVWDNDLTHPSMFQTELVLLDAHICCDMNLYPIDFDLPFKDISERYLHPIGTQLASAIENHVRRNKGAEIIVVADPGAITDPGIRSVVASRKEDDGLTVRAYQSFDPRRYESMVRFDMMFGLGG